MIAGPVFLCRIDFVASINVDDVHRAAFFCALEVFDILLKSMSDLKDAFLCGVEQLGQSVLVHLEILRRDICA